MPEKIYHMAAYIYALCDPDTGEIRYVGKTLSTPKQRLYSHVYCARKMSQKIYRNCWISSILKHGAWPLIKVLEICERNLASEREKKYIGAFRKNGYRLTNLTDGGDGTTGWHHTEESKQRMSGNQRGAKNGFYGRTHTKETRAIIAKNTSNCLRGRKQPRELVEKRMVSIRGQKRTPEQRAALSRVRTGKKYGPLTDEHKDKIRIANMGHPVTTEARIKIGAGQKGRHHTEEAKAKISESLMGNKRCVGYKHTEEAKKRMGDSHRGRVPANKGKPNPSIMGDKNPFYGCKHTEGTKLRISISLKDYYSKKEGI